MIRKLLKDKVALVSMTIIFITVLLGIFAPVVAPNDPMETRIIQKYASPDREFPLGTDHLGRCQLSRLLHGIRPTIFLSLLTTVCTITLGGLVGMIAGYSKGWLDEIIMRAVDVMLSFPSQVMVLAVVGMLGVGMRNVVIATIAIKWAWYARMIRSCVKRHTHQNYVNYAKAVGASQSFIIINHLIPAVLSEIVMLASLDMGWVMISISTLSFLGLGIQPPAPEWGAMLSEAKNALMTHPTQMLGPGIALVLVVSSFNMLGDSLRDALDPKEG
ncbi:nickel/cobalt ABC transporter permease [Anoxynatronum buryatiense]|uniref:Nickel transport system permease protein n=1 Tax=Anoxynatronum buryatiense TaxID=489973 RepID=A0AA45WWY5_9CLOT|nr:nickel/cobalt ABC transporter permease [Anoxynatronum buryatiense]SMP61592.1 nickel transport system permease protein [Anoxynatronum buryatiense]